jgi:WD40 repeat protein
MRKIFLGITLCFSLLFLSSQEVNQSSLQEQIESLRRAELVQSMAQRSILLPGYFASLKGLVARQSYNFWVSHSGDKLVSHLNVYSALHNANKYLGYDSLQGTFYNQILGHGDLVVSIEFAKGSNTFYSAGSDGRLLQWNLDALDEPPAVLYDGPELFRSLDVSYDDQWLLAVTRADGIILVNLEEPVTDPMLPELPIRPRISRDPEPVQTAVFMPNSGEYLSVTKDGKLKLRGFKVDSMQAVTDKQVRTMAVSEETKRVFAGTDEGVVQMWDSQMDESYLELPEMHRINALAISPNKKMLAIGREKGDAIIWDLENEKLIRNISGHQSAIMDLDFSPDNKYLLTASRDRTSRVFEIDNTRKLPMLFDDNDDWVMTATFDHSGQKVITGSKDGFIRV